MGILCWLWPLLTGLLCGILGYLLGKSLGSSWKAKYEALQGDLDACKKAKLKLEGDLKSNASAKTSANVDGKISKLEADLKEEKARTTDLKATVSSKDAKISELEGKLSAANTLAAGGTGVGVANSLTSNNADVEGYKTKISGLESDVTVKDKRIAELEAQLKEAKTSSNTVVSVPFDGDAAKAAFGKKIKQDDLKIVEGIGPKIEGLFHDHGIKTWKALSEASQEKCQEVLASGGERYRIHNPGTWPKQAQLAYEGKWAELVKWQDELDGGVA